MQLFLAYIRVSTVRQGEHGVSLQEQRDAIERYARHEGLVISEWFEERQTAAKRGRPVFSRMLRLLRQGRARGVIMHKIDRSARNFWDWAALSDLAERGVEVRFASEALDLRSRGGRLAADIQAVVAADYVRNLREETRKGFYGRLKQGIFPGRAPLGYLDRGAGKAKELDPKTAPLVRIAFELYATGRYTLASLLAELARRGLRNRAGGPISRNGLSVMLNNPFYIGLIRIRTTGETFQGAHQALISTPLFNSVEAVLAGKAPFRGQSHDFLYRRLLRCRTCSYALIGERQKGRVYYRCHTSACPTTSVREDHVEASILAAIAPLRFSDEEREAIATLLPRHREQWTRDHESTLQAVRLRLAEVRSRMARLTDAYVDRLLDRVPFDERQAALLLEQRGLEEHLASLQADHDVLPAAVLRYLELAGTASSLLEVGLPEERRELIETLTSNRLATARTLDVALRAPFAEIANRLSDADGSPSRYVPRTWELLLQRLWTWVAREGAVQPIPVPPSERTPPPGCAQTPELTA